MLRPALESKAVRWIALGWTAFIAENVVLSHNRDWIIDHYGASNYHNVYNTLSTAACGSIAWGYFKHGRGQGPCLPKRGKAMIVVGSIVQIIGLIGLSQIPPKLQVPVTFSSNPPSSAPATITSKEPITGSQAQKESTNVGIQIRCPMDFKARDVPPGAIYGMERVSRHATFWSLGFTCAGYAMTTVFLPEVVMFSFPLVFALIGSEHQDYRFRRGSGGSLSPEKDAVTSNIPFVALLTGKQSFVELCNELKMVNVGLAVVTGGMFMLRRLR